MYVCMYQGTTASMKTVTEARKTSASVISKLFEDFKTSLKSLNPRELKRPTIQKNSLSNLSRMNILQPDQAFVLTLLDREIQKHNTDNNDDIVLVLSISKFGQKEEGQLDVSALVDLRHVASASVHAACTISANNENLHLLWACCGVQEVVGRRGKLFTALSMCEATNFQSNLDGHALDITTNLRSIFNERALKYRLNFIQLYVDAPHVHLKMPYKHPVSGTIATCGLLHPEINRAMINRALSYMDHMEQLTLKTSQSPGLQN